MDPTALAASVPALIWRGAAQLPRIPHTPAFNVRLLACMRLPAPAHVIPRAPRRRMPETSQTVPALISLQQTWRETFAVEQSVSTCVALL